MTNTPRMSHEWVTNRSRVSPKWVALYAFVTKTSRLSQEWVTNESRVSHEAVMHQSRLVHHKWIKWIKWIKSRWIHDTCQCGICDAQARQWMNTYNLNTYIQWMNTYSEYIQPHIKHDSFMYTSRMSHEWVRSESRMSCDLIRCVICDESSATKV